jgi:hypothetical protein
LKLVIVYVIVTLKLLDISNCLCECYIKERQRYQFVYANVTSKLEIYRIVYVTVTSKLLDIANWLYANVRDTSNCLCECCIEVVRYSKLVVWMLEIHRIVYVNVASKLLNKANCLCECYIEVVIKYSKLFMCMLHCS